MTNEDLEKIKAYIRAKNSSAMPDGDLHFEHALQQKINMYTWSTRVEPTLTVEQYLLLKNEPWLKLPKRGRRRGR